MLDPSFVFAQSLSGLTAAMFLFLIASGLSLIFGVEALVVLKDMWLLDDRQTEAVIRWAAAALVRAAIHGAEKK